MKESEIGGKREEGNVKSEIRRGKNQREMQKERIEERKGGMMEGEEGRRSLAPLQWFN